MGKKTGPNPTDRGKGGVKRSLLTEAHGMPIAIEIDGANRHDMKLVEQTLCQLMIERPEPTHEKPQHLCLDKSDDYDAIRVLVNQFGLTTHIKSCGQQQTHDEVTQASCRWHISSGRSVQRSGARKKQHRKQRRKRHQQ